VVMPASLLAVRAPVVAYHRCNSIMVT